VRPPRFAQDRLCAARTSGQGATSFGHAGGNTEPFALSAQKRLHCFLLKPLLLAFLALWDAEGRIHWRRGHEQVALRRGSRRSSCLAWGTNRRNLPFMQHKCLALFLLGVFCFICRVIRVELLLREHLRERKDSRQIISVS
jgi:hypothetical protein